LGIQGLSVREGPGSTKDAGGEGVLPLAAVLAGCEQRAFSRNVAGGSRPAPGAITGTGDEVGA